MDKWEYGSLIIVSFEDDREETWRGIKYPLPYTYAILADARQIKVLDKWQPGYLHGSDKDPRWELAALNIVGKEGWIVEARLAPGTKQGMPRVAVYPEIPGWMLDAIVERNNHWICDGWNLYLLRRLC